MAAGIPLSQETWRRTACLRLRVAMSRPSGRGVANIWLDHALHAALTAWVKRHYRDRLTPSDLADPALLDEGRRALDELSRLLRIGNVYPFQMA
jgi:succinylarginine dihydrolase